MKKYTTIDEYIKNFPKDVQKALKELRMTIKKAAPKATDGISYGIPTFKLEGNLVHFAAYKNHFGFYPGSSAIATFKKEFSPYYTSKGTVQFPVDKPLPLSLITKVVKLRVKQNLSKKK